MENGSSRKAENICRFTGKLHSFKVQLVGDNQYALGKGILLIPDPNNENIGQGINIMSWGEVADRMSELPVNSWVSMFGSYTPSIYNGAIQDYFTIGGFSII